MRTNTIRFSGLASGLDTDSIVKDLMKPQQLKVDREKKAQALITLKQEAWKDMQKKLYNFHVKFSDKMRIDSTFNKQVTTSSDDKAIGIDNGAVVPGGTHTFNITQLAESVNIVGKITTDKDGNPITKDDLDEVEISNLVDMQGKSEITLKMTVNGKAVSVDVNGADKLGEVAQKINNTLKLEGFAARFDKNNGGLFISSTATGVEQKIQINSAQFKDGGGLTGLLGKLGLKNTEVTGKDAVYTYNGTEFTSSTNKIEINGIKATLKAANTGPVIISSEKDADAIYNWAKEFVTEYNKLMEELNEKLDTKPAKDISPLTSEERAAMSESDIKLWEEKLNSSLFYRDEQLSEFVRVSRNIIGDTHDLAYAGVRKGDKREREYGAALTYNSLASLGIVTGSWQEKGKLYIHGDESDELYSGYTNKLKEAIEKDPDAVVALFTTVGAKLYEEHNDKLIKSNEIKSSMKFYNDKLMNDKIKDYGNRIDTLEERLYKMETAYYAKFAAMEKMLSSMNSQSAWLSQQLGGK